MPLHPDEQARVRENTKKPDNVVDMKKVAEEKHKRNVLIQDAKGFVKTTLYERMRDENCFPMPNINYTASELALFRYGQMSVVQGIRKLSEMEETT